jgi:hypothetical protein
MVEYHYEAFDDWFDEIENYSFRSERFFQHLELFNSTVCTDQRNEFITNWMRAAFDCGRLEKGKYI